MTVFRHKNKWCAEVATGDRTPSGSPRRLRRYARTRAEAERMEREMLTIRDTGQPMPRRDLTVGWFLTDWIARVQTSDRKTSTKKNYQHFVDSVLIPQIGHHKLVDIHQRHVNMMIKNLAETFSPSTARLARRTLSVALNDALRQDLVARNVAQLADNIAGARRKPLRVNPDQIPAILEHAIPYGLHDLITLMVTTGIRRGEACALTWDDIHLDTSPAYVTITKSLVADGGHFVVTTPKTENSVRMVALTDELADRLRQRLIHHQTLTGDQPIGIGYVFSANPTVLLRPDTVTSQVRKIGMKAGIEGLGPHQFRHLFTSMVMNRSDNIALLSKYLGHSNIRTTVDIYGHATSGALLQMKSIVENVITPTNTDVDIGNAS